MRLWLSRDECEAIESSRQAFRDFRPNGCTYSPDKIWGLSHFGKCCDLHDLAYTEGGTEADRKKADKELRACMRSTVAGEGWRKRLTMRWVSWRYYRYIRRFGANHFNYRVEE